MDAMEWDGMGIKLVMELQRGGYIQGIQI